MAIKDDLISWWALDEVSGNRADSHGSNTLTDVNTVTSTTGKHSNASEHVNANGEYLEVADNSSLSLTGAFTSTLWLRSPGASANDCGLLDKCTPTADGYSIRLAGTGGTDDHKLRLWKDSDIIVGTTLHNDSTWRFVACYWDGTDTIEILVDDAQDAISTTATATLADNAHPLRLGARANSTAANTFLTGNLDEVGLWGRKLSSTELTWLYNSGAGRSYSDLVTTQSTSGILTFAGTAQMVTLWKRLQSGALALSSALGIQSLWKRALTGLLQLDGTVDGFRRQFQSIVGTLRFSLGRLQTTVLWKRLMAGTLTFSSLLGAKIPKFVIATIRLVLSPIAVVRTWLSPDADVDIV